MPLGLRKSHPPLLHVAVDTGDGPVVILVHGIASSSVTFQNVVPLLEGRHRCVAIDLLGFGGSPMPETSEYTIDEHVEALEHTILSLHLRGALTLVGHSMGSMIVARLAARQARHHRLKVGAVVLVSPPIYVAPAELSARVDRDVMDFYLKTYAYVRANKEFTLHSARIVERFLAIPKAMDINERTWVPFTKSLENCIESQTTLSDIAAIDAPVEIVYGSMDQFHSEGVVKIVRRMNGVRVHRVLGSDHLIGKRLARAVATAASAASGPDGP